MLTLSDHGDWTCRPRLVTAFWGSVCYLSPILRYFYLYSMKLGFKWRLFPLTKHVTFNIRHIVVGRTTQQFIQWFKFAPSQPVETPKVDVECNGVCFRLLYVSYDYSSEGNQTPENHKESWDTRRPPRVEMKLEGCCGYLSTPLSEMCQ